VGEVEKCGECGEATACSICEACARHCAKGDPVKWARDVLDFSVKTYGEDDEHTRAARNQLAFAIQRRGS
jgi:hypothetical protein